MTPETQALLGKLDAAAWFGSIGRPLPDGVRPAVISVSSWAEAIASGSSDEWSDFVLEQQNGLTMHLHTHARGRYQRWNEIVQSVQTATVPLVRQKLATVGEQLGPDGLALLEGAVQWDVLGACMELEYADLRGPGFFCGLIAWYLDGRYPCGWGEIDETGKLLLYGPIDEGEYDANEPDWLKLVLANQERLYHPKVRLPAAGRLVVY
jgi:hypothetical protein